ncbi:MAG: Ribonuclease P protein component [Candidatus Uhrbacteria bacterium GW2011_GWE2_40_58]|nr:MAG: Ribonuclease P protein component [Candidatus Uhrbacteria bacterium GW2011_GWF2_40_263]KKR67740.1 MAG: Ribonuclease P protein component [Candidatus Uhrbacteria bacterium GW2011_GWE2_40_58]OGL92183.1 MAG: ribonuclease P protein component [Candidatus Uhrbacteria bacterium RIFOXYA2_FULL_40_9]OGL96718.1 MAG: ribonuclease P protein component [Candidatus Uhrbacteria bacterium RIFOXYB2_FULL_41_18]HBK35310.1 ribonuclease P protein component [Candidatus Uhrbacteria bacterium]
MLPKPYRLSQDKDIKTLFAHSKSVFVVTMGIKYRKNKLKNSRFAIAVGTKVSKKAVIRNKIRRQIREIIHKVLDRIVPGFDIMVLVRPSIKEKKFQEIEKEFQSLLKKAHLLEEVKEVSKQNEEY